MKNKTFAIWALRLAAAATLASSGGAMAVTLLARTEASSLPGPGGFDMKSQYSFAPQAVELQSRRSGIRSLPDNADTGLMSAEALAWSRTDLEGIHLRGLTSGAVLNGEPYGGGVFSAYAKASGAFADSFLLSSSAGSDMALSGLIGFRLDGLLSGQALREGSVMPDNLGNAEAWVSISARLLLSDSSGTIGELNLQRSCNMANGTPQAPASFNCSGDSLGLHLLPVTLHSNSTVWVDFQGEIRSSVIGAQTGGGNVIASAVIDLSHTISWGGILGLQTADGQALNDFSALSASSGLDYSKAFASSVPEPASPAMLLAGLLVLAGLQGRARWRAQERRSSARPRRAPARTGMRH